MNVATNNDYKSHQLIHQCIPYIGRILDYLNVDYHENFQRYTLPCPIHKGDNNRAVAIYKNTGIWRCFTHRCEEQFNRTILGFMQGILSNGKPASFEAVENKLKQIITVKTAALDQAQLEQWKFTQLYTRSSAASTSNITRSQIREALEIPCEYYLKRNYPAGLLDRYDVGTCLTPRKQMYNRAVFPIYDEDYRYMVGCTGRIIFESCPTCGIRHNPLWDTCPKQDSALTCKWRHSKGFAAENYLYNYWFAKEHINSSGVAILVESPGDCLRLVEAGLEMCVGLFGCGITEGQFHTLTKSGALSLIVLLNNDDAGKHGMKIIAEKCKNLYRLYFPTLESNDIGDLSPDKVTSDIQPFITQAMDKVKQYV